MTAVLSYTASLTSQDGSIESDTTSLTSQDGGIESDTASLMLLCHLSRRWY